MKTPMVQHKTSVLFTDNGLGWVSDIYLGEGHLLNLLVTLEPLGDLYGVHVICRRIGLKAVPLGVVHFASISSTRQVGAQEGYQMSTFKIFFYHTCPSGQIIKVPQHQGEDATSSTHTLHVILFFSTNFKHLARIFCSKLKSFNIGTLHGATCRYIDLYIFNVF